MKGAAVKCAGQALRDKRGDDARIVEFHFAPHAQK
jgi:hypothetical protein